MKSTESTRWHPTNGSLGRLLIWVLLLTTWEAAYRAFQWKDYIFPAPSHVLDATLDMFDFSTGFGEPLHKGWPMPSHHPTQEQRPIVRRILDSPLISANIISIVRLLVGFSLSILIGASLGMAMWAWEPLDRFLGPVFLGMQTLPSVCWVPMAVLLFSFSEIGVLFVLVMGSVFAVAISLRDGLRTIPPLYKRAGLMMGAGGWRLYYYVMLPASQPALASSLRQGFSFAWRSLMGAELILATERHGLGFLLSVGENNAIIAQVVAVMIMMVIIGMVADRLVFARIEQAVYAKFGLSAGK